jgi:hypothetical protein
MFKKLKLLLALACLMSISACGGGGGGTAGGGTGNLNNVVINNSLPWQTFFSDVPVTPVDISAQQLAIDTDPSGLSFTTEVVVDVDKSGLKTIFIHGHSYPSGCNFQLLSSCTAWASSGYALNDRLIALQIQPNLTIKNITNKVFGTDQVALGGASRKVVAKDINGDGIPDLLYTMNQDHEIKSGEAQTNNDSQTVILLSDGAGKFQISKIGARGFFHTADYFFDSAQTPYAIGASYNTPGIIQKYSNGTWIDVFNGFSDQPISANSFLTVPRSKSEKTTKYIFDDANNDLITTRLRKLINGVWTVVDQWFATDLGYANILETDGSTTSQRLTKIDNEYFLGTGFNYGCIFYVNATASPAVLTTTTPARPSSQVQKAYYNRSELSYVYKYLGFEFTNDKLNYKPIVLPGDTGKNDHNFYKCDDLNGDGQADLIQLTFDGKPNVYFGNGDWTFKGFSSENFPSAPSPGPDYPGWTALHTIFEDVNGDGINDLVYVTGFVKKSEGRNYGMKIYLGKKTLSP